MKKKHLILLLAVTAFASCRTVANKGSANSIGKGTEEADTVEVEEIAPQWPTLQSQPDGSWIWVGPGSERINRVWIGRVCHDTIEYKWKWSIPDSVVQKINKNDREMIDSILNELNTI